MKEKLNGKSFKWKKLTIITFVVVVVLIAYFYGYKNVGFGYIRIVLPEHKDHVYVNGSKHTLNDALALIANHEDRLKSVALVSYGKSYPVNQRAIRDFLESLPRHQEMVVRMEKATFIEQLLYE